MNNRIKELAEQARSRVYKLYASMEVEPDGEFDHWFYEEFEKAFAELIVLGCVAVIEAAKSGVPSVPSEVALDLTAKNVKAYFGVKR